MRSKTFSILFFTKKSKLNKEGEAPIYMRITVDGERSETSLKRTIPINQWDSLRGKAKTSHKFYKDLNQYLDHMENPDQMSHSKKRMFYKYKDPVLMFKNFTL